jgi:hypothetical protein
MGANRFFLAEIPHRRGCRRCLRHFSQRDSRSIVPSCRGWRFRTGNLARELAISHFAVSRDGARHANLGTTITARHARQKFEQLSATRESNYRAARGANHVRQETWPKVCSRLSIKSPRAGGNYFHR